jgi:hypothetical protein
MAVFEMDPTPWLPMGHQILDGGPTRLPRTYYAPAVVPPRNHDNYYVAYIELAQPEGNAFWGEQVRDFVQDTIGLDVMDLQPSLFGVRLLEMRSEATRQILVQHPMRQIEEVFFLLDLLIMMRLTITEESRDLVRVGLCFLVFIRITETTLIYLMMSPPLANILIGIEMII